MVEITQTDNEIKIIIKLINIKSRNPDIVLLKKYIKFNLHPVFFEGHLTNEIDETNSSCKLFKNEARLILKKQVNGLWDEIFEKLPKSDALERRKEMVDALQQKNKEIEQELLKKYDEKKRAEVHKEIERDSEERKKYELANNEEIVNQFTRKQVDDNRFTDITETNIESPKTESVIKNSNISKTKNENRVTQEIFRKKIAQTNKIRSSGKININFTTFNFRTPKRESQDEWQTEYQAEQLRRNMKIV